MPIKKIHISKFFDNMADITGTMLENSRDSFVDQQFQKSQEKQKILFLYFINVIFRFRIYNFTAASNSRFQICSIESK